MPLRQAQGKLSRQPAGPFDSAQGRLLRLRSGQAAGATIFSCHFSQLPADALIDAITIRLRGVPEWAESHAL
jgi:hypothetical protein